MKYIYLYELLFIYEIQVEIERSDSANEILAGLEKNLRNIRSNLRRDGRRSGFRLISGKPVPEVAINMISNIKKKK